MKQRTEQLYKDFFDRQGNLLPLKNNILDVCNVLLHTYQNGGKVLICGNGGSCADSGHIVGELMKGFLLKRPLGKELLNRFEQIGGAEGLAAAQKLQQGLPAISLNAHTALISAFSNDVDPDLVYAQQVIGYAAKGDAVIGISTSGNSLNIAYALMAAKAAGAVSIALSGRDGGKIGKIADYGVIAPESETYHIQECHLAVYHFICAYIESEMFLN